MVDSLPWKFNSQTFLCSAHRWIIQTAMNLEFKLNWSFRKRFIAGRALRAQLWRSWLKLDSLKSNPPAIFHAPEATSRSLWGFFSHFRPFSAFYFAQRHRTLRVRDKNLVINDLRKKRRQDSARDAKPVGQPRATKRNLINYPGNFGGLDAWGNQGKSRIPLLPHSNSPKCQSLRIMKTLNHLPLGSGL